MGIFTSVLPSSRIAQNTARILGFLVGDLLLLYLSLWVGLWVSTGTWTLPHATPWGPAVPVLLVVYVGALATVRLYRTSPLQMHLRDFLRGGIALGVAWIAAISGLYFFVPESLPARGVMIVHGLFVVVTVLGARAVYRLVLEGSSLQTPTRGSSPPSVQLEDLHPRPPTSIDRPSLRDLLSGQTVLVTGAGGSIGVELSTQLLSLDPFRLVLVDVSEHNLYQLETSLRSSSYEGDLEFCIADVRDETVMNGLMETERPDLVFHTAAYKHVPLLERHPAEAFRNNTLATVHLLRLCEEHDVEQFVFVSTDKAVAPKSVLGATKRWAECYVHAFPSSMHRKIVRFGNVFGSKGSVVRRFKEKLAAGEPLPVTHPDMERYFMTQDEACALLLQVLLLDTHPTYIFEMGAPVRIEWLAERLIEEWDPQVDPQRMIEYVGRRPGEKLSETLVFPEETSHPTSHPRIRGVKGAPPHTRSELEGYFQRLLNYCNPIHGSSTQLRSLLLPSQRSSSSVSLSPGDISSKHPDP